MSLATLSPAAGDFDDDLAAFLARVPAARAYDLTEMFDGTPVREHRPSRRVAKESAIDESWREWR